MTLPHPPTLTAGAIALGGALLRSATDAGGGSQTTVTLVVGIIGAVGVIVAALITVIFQRRSSDKPDALAESMYRDLRRDLGHAHTELATAEQRIDSLEDRIGQLETLLRQNNIEVPNDT